MTSIIRFSTVHDPSHVLYSFEFHPFLKIRLHLEIQTWRCLCSCGIEFSFGHIQLSIVLLTSSWTCLTYSLKSYVNWLASLGDCGTVLKVTQQLNSKSYLLVSLRSRINRQAGTTDVVCPPCNHWSLSTTMGLLYGYTSPPTYLTVDSAAQFESFSIPVNEPPLQIPWIKVVALIHVQLQWHSKSWDLIVC